MTEALLRQPRARVPIALLLSAASLGTSLISFLNQLAIARVFGTGGDLDGVLRIMSLPLFLGGTLLSAWTLTLLPKVVALELAGTPAALRELCHLQRLVRRIALASLAAGLLHATTFGLTRGWPSALPCLLAWIGLSFLLLGAFKTSLLQGQGRYGVPALASSLLPSVTLLTISFVGARVGVLAIPLGQMLGFAAGYAMLAFYSPHLSVRDGNMDRVPIALTREAGQAFIPIACTLAYFTFPSTLSDAFWSRMIGNAAMSYLGYGHRLIVAGSTAIVTGPMTVLFTELARLAGGGQTNAFESRLRRTLLRVLSLSALGALALGLIRRPVITALFMRGKFDAQSVEGVSNVLAWLLVGFPPMCAGNILIRAYFAEARNWFIARIAIVAGLLHFTLSGLLIKHWGYQAPAIAYAATWWGFFFAALAGRQPWVRGKRRFT
jgi:putative peptidoglycan lipid II flippase